MFYLSFMVMFCHSELPVPRVATAGRDQFETDLERPVAAVVGKVLSGDWPTQLTMLNRLSRPTQQPAR
jgi:hypothetical protein